MKHQALLSWLGAGLVAFLPSAARASTNDEASVWIAPPAPRFELSDLDGHTVKLSSCTSTAVLVSFVLVDDHPSRRQLEELVRVRATYSADALAMFVVVVDNRPSAELRERLNAQRTGLQFLRYDLPVIEGFGGLTAVPTTFVLDQHRNIIGRHIGITARERLEPELRAILRP